MRVSKYLRVRGRGNDSESHDEGRAFVLLAFNCEHNSVTFENIMNNDEAKSGSFVFCGEKGIKYFVQIILIDTFACIANDQADKIVFRK